MKYLRSFEKYYELNTYVDSTKKLNMDECKELFLKNCSEYDLNSKIYITRNVNIPNSSPNLIDPKSFDRKSANTENYYTYIVDNSEDWKEYPKRKNSIICSYGNKLNRTWLVIPYNGSKWGVCSKFDFWWSFKFQLNNLNKVLSFIYVEIIGKELKDDTEENFFDCLDKLSIALSSYPKNKFGTGDNKFDYAINRLYDTIKENNFDVRKSLEKILNPKENGMQVMNYEKLVEFGTTEYSKMGTSFEREIWTDSKCILFPIDYLDKSVAIETLKEWRNI